MDKEARACAADSSLAFFRIASRTVARVKEGVCTPARAMKYIRRTVAFAERDRVEEFLKSQVQVRSDPATKDELLEEAGSKSPRTESSPDTGGNEGSSTAVIEQHDAYRLASFTPGEVRERSENADYRRWLEQMLADDTHEAKLPDNPVIFKSEYYNTFAVQYGSGFLLVHPNFTLSLVRVINARVRRDDTAKGDVAGTSNMSLSMVAELLRLDRFDLALRRLHNTWPACLLWGRAERVWESLPDARTYTMPYATCLFYLQDHSMFELWRLEAEKFNELMHTLDEDDAVLLLDDWTDHRQRRCGGS